MDRPKIGLALGSGGARGFAHIGVLKVLEEANIPIDFIAGSSIGSLAGVLYGAGQSPETLEKFAKLFRRKYYLDFTVPKMGFVAGKKVKELIHILAKGKNLEELSPPVWVVATDLLKGERVVFKDGPAAPAIRASISIPGIFVPEKKDGRLLVDGGVIDRVPVSVVKEMGADITIAVDISYFQVDPPISSIYDVILQTMDIMEREMVRLREIDTDVMIRPMVKQASSIAFTNVEEYIRLGEEEAKKQLDLIHEQIDRWKEKQLDGH
ncbi:patatin-like phospholipase family protein [Alkalihalobacterium chitinilyticum]|uniref:Patatin-like phospholipase family protein n=1 Tax=Alkalihalobacterium chitinilyticum TaxID=2980103 RepID=A0ABT5VCA2_9BACI|nr:patatin-like phospholipase family protein [Alkalihalobacterium chitinilyticum]MDE5413080.1 patatin-like phospholipase family protein [Alkalihalobacterium chitinilyticum]